jgi:hypothetical protein
VAESFDRFGFGLEHERKGFGGVVLTARRREPGDPEAGWPVVHVNLDALKRIKILANGVGL